MLEVKLLKVYHHGKKEARKLSPYIAAADVFSIENALTTEREARISELKLEEIFATNVGKDKFFKNIRAMCERGGLDSGSRKYTTVIYGELFKKKLPIWYLERFQREEAIKLRIKMAEYVHKTDLGYTALHQGDKSSYLRLCWETLQINELVTERRDKEIAKNIDKAEEGIRGRYDHLRDKENIKLAVMIGGTHSPESFTKCPVEIIDLMDNSDSVSHRCQLILRSGMSFDESKPLMLEAGYFELLALLKR